MAQNDRVKIFPSNAGQTNESTTRRRLLSASVVAGTAPLVPTAWKSPVVESVLLPAHAQSSPGESGSDESSSSQPQTISVTKACGDGPNNEYYTIIFPNDSASTGSSFTIEGPFSTNPGVSGDNVVFRFSNDEDQVFLDDVTSGLNPITNPFCGNPSDSFDDGISLANGTNTLDFTVDTNISSDEIQIVVRDLVVN